MSAPSCSKCQDTRWVSYFSETLDGDFEEAFRLCPCNREPKMGTQSTREESGRSKTAAEELASQ